MRVTLLLLILSFTHIPDARCQSVKRESQNKQQPSPAKAIENAPSPQADQGNAPKDVQSADKEYSAAVKEMPPKDSWDKAYIILTGCLVSIGAVTLIGILIQAKETKNAARAARDSIRLQELAFTQWVTTDNWCDKGIVLHDTGGGHVIVEFDIINPTGFPLTVTAVSLRTLDGEDETTVKQPYFVPAGGKYPSGIRVRLKEARVGASGELIVSPTIDTIIVNVTYTDVLKRPQSQEFAESCTVISQHKIDFTVLSLPVLRKLTEEERQNPN